MSFRSIYFKTWSLILTRILCQIQKYFSELFVKIVPKGHAVLKLVNLDNEDVVQSAVG